MVSSGLPHNALFSASIITVCMSYHKCILLQLINEKYVDLPLASPFLIFWAGLYTRVLHSYCSYTILVRTFNAESQKPHNHFPLHALYIFGLTTLSWDEAERSIACSHLASCAGSVCSIYPHMCVCFSLSTLKSCVVHMCTVMNMTILWDLYFADCVLCRSWVLVVTPITVCLAWTCPVVPGMSLVLKAQWITTLKVNCACGCAGNIAIANIVDLWPSGLIESGSRRLVVPVTVDRHVLVR